MLKNPHILNIFIIYIYNIKKDIDIYLDKINIFINLLKIIKRGNILNK